MYWDSLFLEVREMILVALIHGAGSVAPFASVSREWQAAIEEQNFSRLSLTIPRLAYFNELANRNKGHVRYIWLCIDLAEYDCSECNTCIQPEMEAQHYHNTQIIEESIRSLFRTLSNWKPKKDLALDIGIHSPSDSKHYFKNIHFESNVMSTYGSFESERRLSGIHDPRHHWVDGKQISLPSKDALYRLFEDIELDSEFWQEVPEVTAVTSLVLRRQTRYRWEPGTLGRLLDHLPNVQELSYEPWREWGLLDQRISDKSHKSLFESLIPNRLKKMVIFEDFNDTYIAIGPRLDELLDAEPVRTASHTVTRALAEAILTFEHLSAAFIVDAKWYLEAHQPNWVWKDLESLTLTSRLLVPDQNFAEINDMLQTAAEVTKKMPRLNNMELWNGGKGFAGVFKYRASKICRQLGLTIGA